MRSGGGIRRFASTLAAVALASVGFGANAVPSASGRGAHVFAPSREDIYLGRWSYARKGKRTAAQIQRAARKKRNRKRNK